MPDFKQQYKNPRPGFGDADHRRYIRAYNYDRTRREVRTRTFDKNRNLQGVSAPTSPQPTDVSTITDERMKKLITWREERNRKKKLEAAMKKPAFKVGVVHHSWWSPRLKVGITVNTPKKPKHPDHIQKRITRATEKRLRAKELAAKQPTTNLTSLSVKQTTSTKTSASNTKKSFAPVDYCFKPPPGLQKLPLFGLVPIKGTPQDKHTSDDSIGITEDFKTSTPALSPSRRNLSQKLKQSAVHDSNDLNARLLLNKQIKNETYILDSSQKEKILSNSSNTSTPSSQKIAPASSEKENCLMEDLIIFSPYLTRSRGKRNSRREVQQKLGIGRPSDEIPTKDTVMKNLNICVEEEERTAQYFKFLLNKETNRLKELCEKWLNIGLENDIPEDATYEIQQAVGQTNLLINKKFERFRSLVRDCETGKGEMLVTCRDLQGFWDMTYMEVQDCDTRFEKLEQLQNRGWQEEEYLAPKPVKKRMAVKKQIVSKPSSKPSSLRSMILAARKNKMEVGTLSKEDQLSQNVHINEKSSNRKYLTTSLEENIRRSRRSKSHSLNESKRIPVRYKSSTNSSQFSDKSKKMKSPFAAMKISRMCKTPDVQLDDTISYVNSDQTPGKSILKKSEELENKEARIKSAHKVNFDDQVVLTEVPLDEETQTRLSLADALNKIDSIDLDDMYQSPRIRVEKTLNFEDSDIIDDLNELEPDLQTIEKQNKSISPVQNTLDHIVSQPLNDITSSISNKESSPNNIKILPRKSLRNRVQHKDPSNGEDVDVSFSPPTRAKKDDEMSVTPEIISKEMEDLDIGTKVLRNRTVLASNTPKSKRTSRMMTPKRVSSSKEKNKSPVKLNRKNSLKLSHKDKNVSSANNTMEMENVTLTDNHPNIRKSLRKSVAFDETCVVCAENKPVLPMTPYSVRRNKTPSRQSRNRHALNEDLTSWETPDKKHRPRRVTRSKSENL